VGGELADELQAYTGSAGSARQSVDLFEVVAEVCSLVEPELSPNLCLKLRRPGRPLSIDGDPVQLRECISSLLVNAVEATQGDDREIEVVVEVVRFDPSQINDLVCGAEQPPGDFAYVEIRDEGGGMDREVEERAFEPFFSTREKNRGSGLSTVLGIARAHDAVVALYNDPGWGCTFCVYFPLRRG
jgi:signal transduction histidine kinase